MKRNFTSFCDVSVDDGAISCWWFTISEVLCRCHDFTIPRILIWASCSQSKENTVIVMNSTIEKVKHLCHNCNNVFKG